MCTTVYWAPSALEQGPTGVQMAAQTDTQPVVAGCQGKGLNDYRQFSSVFPQGGWLSCQWRHLFVGAVVEEADEEEDSEWGEGSNNNSEEEMDSSSDGTEGGLSTCTQDTITDVVQTVPNIIPGTSNQLAHNGGYQGVNSGEGMGRGGTEGTRGNGREAASRRGQCCAEPCICMQHCPNAWKAVPSCVLLRCNACRAAGLP